MVLSQVLKSSMNEEKMLANLWMVATKRMSGQYGMVF